jgi:hypothetical protein
MGRDTMHHFFVNAFNNFENPIVGGALTFSQFTFMNGPNFRLGGDPDIEDRNANGSGLRFGSDLGAKYLFGTRQAKEGTVSNPDYS